MENSKNLGESLLEVWNGLNCREKANQCLMVWRNGFVKKINLSFMGKMNQHGKANCVTSEF